MLIGDRPARIHRPPRRMWTSQHFDVPAGTIQWNGTYQLRKAVYVLVDSDEYKTAWTAEPVHKNDIVAEYAGTIFDSSQYPDGRPTNWFIAIPGFLHTGWVVDGAIRPQNNWPFHRYLNEAKIGPFIDSSQITSGTHNYSDANCKIEWNMYLAPQDARAIFRATDDLPADVPLKWDYNFV